MGDLKVRGISLFTVLATLTKKLLKALAICFGSLRSLPSTEIWEINLDEDCRVLTIFLISDQIFFHAGFMLVKVVLEIFRFGYPNFIHYTVPKFLIMLFSNFIITILVPFII